MTQRKLEDIVAEMIETKVVDADLLKRYKAYVILNYKALEEVYMRPASEPKDRLCFQLGGFSAEELELKKRIEEAKRKETFSERLIRLIKESGKTPPEIYRAAGVDSRHFSKINSNREYKPSKETVCAFAIALHLSVKEAEALLEKAGFAFSSSNIFDVTIKFFLENRYYDRKEIDLIMENMNIPLMRQNF